MAFATSSRGRRSNQPWGRPAAAGCTERYAALGTSPGTGTITNDDPNCIGGNDPSKQVLVGTPGDDVFCAGGGNDSIQGMGGNDTIDGGPGTDTVIYTDAPGGVNVNLATGVATGDGTDTISNVENVTGSNFNDTIVGGTAKNILIGGKGNDSIDGGAGKDTASFAKSKAAVTANLLTGTAVSTAQGSGSDTLTRIESLTGTAKDDTLIGNSAANTLNGAGGTDTVSYASASGGQTVDLGAGAALGADGTDKLKSIENVTGSNFADTITGGNTANVIKSGAGNDTINVIDGQANDSVDGGTDTDSCQHDAGDIITNCES